MGTSKSFGGPRDKTPLLPQWALAQSAPGSAPAGPAAVPTAPVAPTAPAQPTAPTQPSPANNGKANWQAAKRAIGQAVRPTRRTGGGGRGGGGRAGVAARMRSAGRGYVRASGGSAAAARSARSGRAATGALGAFLSDVANRGLGTALRDLGLQAFAGRDADTVFAAIANAIAAPGASREEVAARQATNQALDKLSEELVSATGDVSRLEAMTPQDITAAIEASVSSYIYNRWLTDLGVKVEQRAVSAAQAVQFERQMKLHIEDTIRFDFTRIDPLRMNWKEAEGQAFIERIYTEAYSVIGGEP